MEEGLIARVPVVVALRLMILAVVAWVEVGLGVIVLGVIVLVAAALIAVVLIAAALVAIIPVAAVLGGIALAVVAGVAVMLAVVVRAFDVPGVGRLGGSVPPGGAVGMGQSIGSASIAKRCLLLPTPGCSVRVDWILPRVPPRSRVPIPPTHSTPWESGSPLPWSAHSRDNILLGESLRCPR